MKRFELDENMPAIVATVLREAGHDVATALDEGLGGAPDGTVIEACKNEPRTLLTLDLDFADMRTYGPAGSPGIIVMRLPHQVWILEPHRIRIWREVD